MFYRVTNVLYRESLVSRHRFLYAELGGNKWSRRQLRRVRLDLLEQMVNDLESLA